MKSVKSDSGRMYFSSKELMCRCGECSTDSASHMSDEFLEVVKEVREMYAKPMTVTSAYRCATHPAEARKSKPGFHAEGICLDIACSHSDFLDLLHIVSNHPKVKGIGMNQKGTRRFLHFDIRKETLSGNAEDVWTY